MICILQRDGTELSSPNWEKWVQRLYEVALLFLYFHYYNSDLLQLACHFAGKIGSDFAPGKLIVNQSEFKQFKFYQLIIP